MIIGSLLLIVAAVVMLGFGLPAGSDPLLIGSIVAALLAVVLLIGSARRAAARRLAAAVDGLIGKNPPGKNPPGGDPPGGDPPGGDPPGGDPPGGDPPGGAASASKAVTAEPTSGRAGGAGDGGAGDGGGSGGARDSGRDGAILSQARPVIDLNVRPASDGADGGEDYAQDYAEREFSDEDPPGEPPPQLVSATDAALVAGMNAAVLVIDGRPRYHQAGCAHLRGRPTEPLPASEAVELGFTPCGRCEPDSALIAGAR